MKKIFKFLKRYLLILTSSFLFFLSFSSISNKISYNKSFDLSFSKKFSLSLETKKLLDDLNHSGSFIYLRSYFRSSEDRMAFKSKIDPFLSSYSFIKLSFLDPDQDILEAKSDEINTDSVVVVQIKDKKLKINHFNEASFYLALQRLKQNHHRSVAFIGCPMDNTSPEGMSQLKNELLVLGIQVNQIMPLDKELEQNQAVVLCGRDQNLSIEEIKNLSRYINSKEKRNFLIFLDAMRPADNINLLTEEFGIKYEDDFLVLSKDNIFASRFGQNNTIIDWIHPDDRLHMSLSDQKNGSFLTAISDSRSLSLNPIHKSLSYAAVQTAEDSIRIKDTFSPEDLKEVLPERLEKGSFIFAAVSKKLDNHLKAFGSSQLLKNAHFSSYLNRDLVFTFLLERSSNERPVSWSKIFSADYIAITSNYHIYSLILICFAYPFIFLIAGFFVWRSRLR